MSKLFFNKKGQSSITVIILAGLVITLSAGAYISYLSLVREEKAGREKMSALDLEQKMIMSMGGNSCLADLVNTNLNPSAPYRLNTTSKNTLAQTNINLNKLHSSAANSTNALVEQDKPASSMNKDVLIDKINLKNVQPTAIANQYSIDIEITFKGNNLVRQISPVILTKNIYTDPADPVTAQKVLCSGAPAPPSGPITMASPLTYKTANKLRCAGPNGTVWEQQLDVTINWVTGVATYKDHYYNQSWTKSFTPPLSASNASSNLTVTSSVNGQPAMTAPSQSNGYVGTYKVPCGGCGGSWGGQCNTSASFSAQ